MKCWDPGDEFEELAKLPPQTQWSSSITSKPFTLKDIKLAIQRIRSAESVKAARRRLGRPTQWP